jgi:hypothetical protein
MSCILTRVGCAALVVAHVTANAPVGTSAQTSQNARIPTRVVYAGPQGGNVTPRAGQFGSALWGGRVGGHEIIAIGAPYAGCEARPDVGELVVLEDRKIAWRAKGRCARDMFGSSLAALDHKDAGSALAIGAIQGWGTHGKSSCGPGRVELRKLSSGELLWEATGDKMGDWFGDALCALEDLDGDGCSEIAVGATQGGRAPSASILPGSCAVLSSRDGSRLWTTSGRPEDRRFGFSLARIADLDEDGVDDLLVGAPGRDEETECGRIVALSAASGAELASIDLTSSGLRLGSTLLSAGDLSGDSCRDVLAVALEPVHFKSVTARVLLVSGNHLELHEIGRIENLFPRYALWEIPLALGHSREGSSRIIVGLPGQSAGQFSESLGSAELIDLSGARVARFEPDRLEQERTGSDWSGHLNTGACVAAIEGAPVDQDSIWLIGAPGFFCWGSVAIVRGTDWKGRQLVVENELFHRPVGFDTRAGGIAPGKPPRFGSLGREDPRKP